MPITLTEADVEGAGGLDADDYTAAEMQFAIDYAEGIINEELSPSDTNNMAYVQTAALVAAAVVSDDAPVSSLSGPSRSISFDTGRALSLLEKAYARDPTNRLQELLDPDADEPFVFTA